MKDGNTITFAPRFRAICRGQQAYVRAGAVALRGRQGLQCSAVSTKSPTAKCHVHTLITDLQYGHWKIYRGRS